MTDRGLWRNGFLLFAVYAYIAGVVAASLWFFWSREEWGMPLVWDFPVGVAAILFIGPAQHRLWLLGQEAAMGNLFRNRWLNELAGDWLIHFPFSSATQHVRQQVLLHARFPNDPLRDPERIIAERAGFWPLGFGRLLRLSALLKWNGLRATFNFEANPDNPYYDPQRPPSRVALNVGTAYVLVMFAVLIYLYFQPDAMVLAVVPPAMWALAMLVFWRLPDDKFYRGKLPSLYSPKTMTLMRCTFITLVNCGLGWTSYLTGRSAVLNYIALWMAPMFTATTMLMLTRQWRQHRGRTTENGDAANELKPGFFARLLLFPMNQHRHPAWHHRPETPFRDLR